MFVFLLPVFAGLSMAGSGFAPADFGPLPLDGLLLSSMALAVSHVVSFFVNFIGRQEYRAVSPAGQMMRVYGSVFVLHATVLGGAFLAGILGTPFAALVLLVVLKTAADLFFHLREHRRLSAASERQISV